jgi:DNA replication protein DnaC
MTPPDALKARAQALKLYGLLAHWSDLHGADWVEPLLNWEEAERCQRSLERRLKSAQLGRFKPLADFDWSWPRQCDRALVMDWMGLGFLKQAINPILVGPNGVGKSTLALNVAHQAALQGHSVLFLTAGQMLGDLSAQESDAALKRRLAQYARPALLVIDELGYLSYANRHADLLFEVVSRRYEQHSTLVTTNRPFAEWNEVFPNAACAVSLVDRLVHHSEILAIEADSYRLKEAKERQQRRAATPRRTEKRAAP